MQNIQQQSTYIRDTNVCTYIVHCRIFSTLLIVYLRIACASFPIGRQVLRTRAGVQEYVSSVSFASPAPAPRVQCPHCPTTFVNAQGLGLHMKTNHSTANVFQGQRLQRMLGDDAKGDVLPWERAGPGRCYHVKIDGITGAASFVLQPKRVPNIDLESDGFTPAEPKSARRGAAKRNRYDFRFKAHVIQQLRILEEDRQALWQAEHLSPLQYLETHMKVPRTNISKWVKDEDEIVAFAADEVKQTLLAKQQPYTFAGDGDSSDDEGSSETGNDGCGGGDDQTVEGEGDHSGEGVEDGDSSDEDTRGKLDAYQGFSLHCLVVVAVAVAFALAVAVKSTDICMRR